MIEEVRRTGMHAFGTLIQPSPRGREQIMSALSGLDPFIETFTPTLQSGLMNGGVSRPMLRTVTLTLSQRERESPGRRPDKSGLCRRRAPTCVCRPLRGLDC
jgi:hypothetical protein